MHTLEAHLEAVLLDPRLRGARFSVEVFRGARVATGIVLVRGTRADIAEHADTVTALLRYSEPNWRIAGCEIDYRFMALDAMAA